MLFLSWAIVNILDYILDHFLHYALFFLMISGRGPQCIAVETRTRANAPGSFPALGLRASKKQRHSSRFIIVGSAVCIRARYFHVTVLTF